MAAACLLGVALAASALPTPVEVARSEAESNAQSPAGKRYEGVMVSRLEEWLRPALEQCVKKAAREELISFDALVRVGDDGKAEEVVFGPETEVARCVAPAFQDRQYPRPPKPSWWVKIEVRLK